MCAAERNILVITRRAFIQTTVGCLAAATALPLQALAPLNIGISTVSYHSLSLADMIAQLKILLPMNGLNNQEIEMSRSEFTVMNHPSDDVVRSVRKQLDDAGIRCISYYSSTLKKDQVVTDAIRFAKLLGARNITGDATGSNLLKQIDQSVTQAGLTFGIHNQFVKGNKSVYESPEDVLNALAGLSDSCGATVDTGNFASCGHDSVDTVRKLGSRLKIVHLKDVKAVGEAQNVLLGTGIAKISEVEEELHRQNFRRMIAVEYEKEGDVIEDMQKNVEYAWKYGFSGA
jgi:sugar phosphate isomerase/epimerase